jgi:hypothetical protein
MPSKKPDLAAKTGPLSVEDREALGREYQQLDLARAAAVERQTAIKERFRDALDFGTVVAGPAKVSIQHNITRDDAKFAEIYPFEDYPDYYAAKPDTAAIKRNLAPVEIEKFQREGAPKVVITFFE